MNEELKIFITAELGKLHDELKKGQKETKDFAEKGKKNFKEFNDAVQSVGTKTKAALKVVSGAVLAVGAALVASSAATREYRQNQAMLNTAFETAGASAEVAKGVYEDLYRVLGDNGQATEAAQHLAKLTTNQRELEQWTKITQGVYATFGASLPVESLTEAINHTAKLGEVQGSLADALEWSGISVDDFNAQLLECNTEAEREALIRETLGGLYNEAAENYEKNAASVLAENEAQMKLDESMAKLGATMAPILVKFAEMASIILDQVSPAIDEFMKQHGDKLTKTLTDIAEAIGKVITWIVDNWDWIAPIAATVLAIAAALSVLSTIMGIVNAIMLASPVTWIVVGITAAVAALVAIIVLCIKYWDEIKAAGAKAWEWIKNAWNTAANWFNEKIIQPIVRFFSGMWDGLKNGASKAWEGIKSVFSAVTGWFTNIFTKAWQGVKNVFSAGGKIFDGIKEGIANVFKTVVNGIIGGINKVIAVPFNAINSALSKIRDISILGLTPFSWIKTFSVPQIPKLARGGIIDSATIAMVGERGKEAVVPLENNLGWLDKLASMLGDKLGERGPIYLVCDKRVIGQIASEGINGITKQTGKIPLVFA